MFRAKPQADGFAVPEALPFEGGDHEAGSGDAEHGAERTLGGLDRQRLELALGQDRDDERDPVEVVIRPGVARQRGDAEAASEPQRVLPAGALAEHPRSPGR
jgi:hypothetical protein